jgi:peptidoglycan-associated lipoprotein
MMKKSLLLLVALAVAMMLFAGCDKYPAEELAKAEQAVQEAKAAGAPTNCADKYAAAESKLAEAKQAADVDKDYEKATSDANETVILANVAKGCPPPIAEATPAPPPPPAPAKLDLSKVYFDYNRYNIRSDAAATLKKNADLLAKYPGKMIFIEGHCDERGTSEYNMALGERRAKSVKNYYISLGIKADMKTLSFGESKPANPGHSEKAYAQNRRVEFKDTGK